MGGAAIRLVALTFASTPAPGNARDTPRCMRKLPKLC